MNDLLNFFEDLGGFFSDYFSSIIAIGTALIMLIISIRRKKKADYRINNFIKKGDYYFSQGSYPNALKMYKSGLAIVLGMEGETVWVSKSLVIFMNNFGWNILKKIDAIYKQQGQNINFMEWKELINDFHDFSLNRKYINKYGDAKGKGKDIFQAMRIKLVGLFEEL